MCSADAVKQIIRHLGTGGADEAYYAFASDSFIPVWRSIRILL